MNLPLYLTLFALAPQDQSQEVPLLGDLPLIGELFQAPDAGPVPDPELQWNGETEDIYRRAMHLIQVRAKYAEAAGLLLGIADSDSVIQVPGQAAWVLGQAALALYMDGRKDQADALLPGIRSGAAGTALEPQVGVLLQRMQRFQEAEQQLDETFLKYLWNRLEDYPRDDKDSGSDIRDYGRLALPYLEYIVVSQLRLSESAYGDGNVEQVRKAMRFGLQLADRGYVDRTLALLREFPPLTTRILVPEFAPRGIDSTADAAQGAFFLALAADSDPSRRTIGMAGAMRHAQQVGGAQVIAFLESVAGDLQDDRRPALLAEAAEGARYHHADWFTLLGRLARGQDAELREAVRWGMLGEAERADELREFASNPGAAQVDKLRFLAQFKRPTATDTRNGEPGPLTQRAIDALASVGVDAAKPFGWQERQELTTADRAVMIELAGDADAGVAAMAAFAANELRRGELVDAVFPHLSSEIREALLAEALYWSFGAETAHALLQLAAEGSAPAHVALAGSRFPHLRVRELQASGISWTDQEWQRYAEGREGDGEGAADLVDLLAAPGGFPEARWTALKRLPREAALRGLDGLAGWYVDAEQGEAWHKVLREAIERVVIDQTGETRDDLGELGEDLARFGWSAAVAHDWSLWLLHVSSLLQHQWKFEPERAYALASTLVTDAPSLARYREDLNVGGGGSAGWKQKFLLDCLRRGWWPLDERDKSILGWIEYGQPEFLEVVRLLLQPGKLPSRALDLLEDAPEARRSLAAEIEPYWSDPSFVYQVVDIYDNTPELKAMVPQMLAAWQLDGLEGRGQILGAMASTLDERVVPVLLEALGDPDALVSSTAKFGLERMREVHEQREYWQAWQATGSTLTPVVALIQKLRADSREVRIAAIRSLATMQAPEALPFLVELLEDDDQEIRTAAAAALEKING